MADPILTQENVYAPGEIQTPEQLPSYIPAEPMPQVDFNSYSSGLTGNATGGGSFNYDSYIRGQLSKVPTNRAEVQAFTPIKFNARESGFDPLYNSFKDTLYRTEGFIPYRDNEDLYARELGKSGQLWQGIKGILPLAGIAHNEAWKSEADMWAGLVQGDLNKALSLTMDKDDLLKLNELSNEVNNSHYVPLTQEQREGSFNMGKFSRGLQQFGFTLGTTAQFLEQTALETAVTALTAPGTVGGSILAEIGNLTRRAVKTAGTLEKLYTMNKAFKNIMKFENAYLDSSKIAKMFNTFNDLRKTSPIKAFGNFYKATKEYNFAASEARFERAQSYADYVEGKELEFFEKYGRDMNDDERKAVEEDALKVSNANGITNVALLLAMNRLNMGNVLRSGFGLSKAIAAEAGTIADDIIMRSAKSSGESLLTKYFKKKAAKETEKMAAQAGSKMVKDPFMKASEVKMFSAEWFKGKGNNMFRWGADSAWEGIQENAQGISHDYWQSYYEQKATLTEEARNDWGHLMGISRKAMSKALGKQMSLEGLDTFVSGFIIGVPSVVMNRGIGLAQRKIYSKEYAAREQKLQETVNSLNKWANSPMQVFNRNLEGYVNQNEIAEGFKRAAMERNPYAFKNLERKAFQEFVMTAHKAGKLDAMLDMLEQSSKDLTDEEFKEAYGFEADSLGRKASADYVSSLKTKAKDFVKELDDVSRRMPNPYNYKQYKEGTNERIKAEFGYLSWNKALEDYVFMRDTHKDIVTRYKDILSKNQENLGAQSYPAFYTLTNDEFVVRELNLIKDNIRMLSSADVLSPEQRDQLKSYKKRQELLTKWRAELSTKIEPGQISAPATPSKVFVDYLNMFQEQALLPPLEADKLRDAFNDLSDLYRLDKDQRTTIKNLNYLADPENFLNLHLEHSKLMGEAYQKLLKHREEKNSNYDKLWPLILNDIDFRFKHSALIKELEDASVAQDTDLIYNILDQLYEAEFGEPVVGKEEEEKTEEKTEETTEKNDEEEQPTSSSIINENDPAFKAEIEKRRKLTGWSASYELAAIAKKEGVDLSKLSREEYADYAIKNYLKIDDSQLRANVKHRNATSVQEITEMMKADRASLSEESKKAFDSFYNAMMSIVDKPQVERYLAKNVRLLSGTKDSNSWLFFSINNGTNDNDSVTHKSYFSLKDLNDFSPEVLKEFMVKLQERGYNGGVKIFQDLEAQGPALSDQVVMHGYTEADAKLALEVAKEFYGDKLLDSSIGKDEVINGKNKSYSQILADKIKNEIDAKLAAFDGKQSTATTPLSDIERRRSLIRAALQKAVNPIIVLIDGSKTTTRIETLMSNEVLTPEGYVSIDIIKQVISQDEVKEYGTGKILAKKGEVLYDAELADLDGKQPGSSPGGNQRGQSGGGSKVNFFQSILKDIADGVPQSDIEKKLEEGILSGQIDDKQADEIVNKLTERNKKNQQGGNESKPLSETSREFVNQYNDLISEMNALLSSPDATRKAVEALWLKMQLLINQLEPGVQSKYKVPLKEKLSKAVKELERREISKDAKKIKLFIDSVFNKPNLLITDAVEKIFEVLDMELDPSFKDEVIAYFESAYRKAIDKRVDELKKRMTSVAGSGSPLLDQYIKDRERYIEIIKTRLENFKQKAADLNSLRGEFVLATEIKRDFSTTVNKRNRKVPIDVDATFGQSEAIDNMIASGTIGDDDLKKYSRNQLSTASELINLGVSRIFALQINKAAEKYVKNPRDKANEKELQELILNLYEDSNEGGKSSDVYKVAEEKVRDVLADKSINTVDDILNEFGFNKTIEISDEQYSKYKEFRKQINSNMSDANTLNIIQSIEERKQNAITNGIKNADEFLDTATMSMFEKLLSGPKASKDLNAFKNEILSIYDSIQKGAKTSQVGLPIVELATAKMWNADTGTNLIKILLTAMIEAQSAVGNTDSGVKLTFDQIADIIENPGVTPVLDNGQIAQVKDFSEELLKDIKTKFKAATGFSSTSVDMGGNLVYNESGISIDKLAFLSLRPKDATDLRNEEDLRKAIGAKDDKVGIKQALQFIIDSDFATDTEKLLARNMMSLFNDSDTIKFDNTIEGVGDFDPETGEINIDLSATAYREGYPSSALETVILHELIHKQIETAIADPKSEYTRALRSVYNAVKNSELAGHFYAFNSDLSPDEQLREFVTEAFTNPAFQYLLAKIPYANSKKTTWQVFMDFIKKLLEKLGVMTDETALSEVLNLTSEILNTSSGEMLEKIGLAKSLTDLDQLRKQFKKLYSKDAISESEYDTLSSAITANKRRFRIEEYKNKLKHAFSVEVEGRTYYYVTDATGMSKFEIYTLGRNNPRRVRSQARVEAVLTKLAEKNGYIPLIEDTVAEYIRELMGPLDENGTYASGNMSDVMEGYSMFPSMYSLEENAFQVTPDFKLPSLGFRSVDEFNSFEKEYTAAKKLSKMGFSRVFGELRTRYPAVAVENYGEVYSAIGDVKQIRKLIKVGALSVTKGSNNLKELIYDTNNEVMDFLQWVDRGGLFDKSKLEATEQKINAALKDYFGIPISKELQKKIEFEFKVPSEEEKESGIPVVKASSTFKDEVASGSMKPLDYMLVLRTPLASDKSAQNENPFRSTSNDLYYDVETGEPVESNYFTSYYHKVRDIINKLHIKPVESLKDYRVTITKNNSMLRWDGSDSTMYDLEYSSDVIGYISDKDGNPIIFNKEGEQVGVIDKNNLQDSKGLRESGENQIVYFNMLNEFSNAVVENKLDPNAKEAYDKMVSEVKDGRTKIARLNRITAGVMNLKDVSLLNATSSPNTLTSPELRRQLSQDHVDIVINKESGELNALIKDASGAINRRGLLPPFSRNARVELNDQEIAFVPYTFAIIRTFLERNLEKKIPAESGIYNNLRMFVQNIWLTGDKYNLRISNNLQDVTIIENKERVTYNIFTLDKNSKKVIVDENNLKKVMNYIGRLPINIYSQWFNGVVPFMFPVLDQQDGVKKVTFVQKNFKDFLINEVGLKVTFQDIPDVNNLKRYNSIVEFVSPKDLNYKAPAPITEQEVVDDPNSIKNKTDEVSKDSKNAAPINIPNPPKKKKFFAPKLNTIYTKVC